ncbi:AarF/ABC1/UbiB kinase family protein [Azoarcus sp. KH32C]|uniref:AarF/ABC1/UbiB kinase family protein n=1 Tax=Azoarcus sp. KH32C TaxID=748247 RepID=UPI0002386054|nr:AarF/ABC1/UbiB kinase family protein [Azoarcus sp. KH32C]BAL25639.1 putative ubiquinone biosynthesis protein [Azoarcus sp. KH32C]
MRELSDRRDLGGKADSDDMPDAAWLEAIGLYALLPPSLQRWRPLVEEAALFFLAALPPDRLNAILLGQLALDVDAGPAQRLVTLLAQCPTLHKLGQVLARQPRLDPELCRQLQSLESMPATTSLEDVLAQLRSELGESLAVEVASAALAEGSVAIVVPFTYEEDGRPRDGVFKVLRPGVEVRLAEELAILPDLADLIERRAGELGLPALDYRDTLESIGRLLMQEIRLDEEQRHLVAARKFYADERDILIPRLLPWCTPQVTAMERVFGSKLNDAELSARQREELAETVVRALLAKPFWTRADPAIFHGDLHGGNLFVTPDGRLAVLDWSLVAHVSKADREALLAAALGAFALDAPKIRHAIAALGSCGPDDPALIRIVEDALDRLVSEARMPGFDWLLALLDELALTQAAGFRGDLGLFRKSWLALSGVVRDLAGNVPADLPLIDVGLRRFLAELPSRWFTSPHTRDFSTHVSAMDLLDLCVAPWLAAMRLGARVQALGLQRLGDRQVQGARALRPRLTPAAPRR